MVLPNCQKLRSLTMIEYSNFLKQVLGDIDIELKRVEVPTVGVDIVINN
jgi:hypothetical protein